MDINLKQPEIIKALRDYIANKGINLSGKTVSCVFTAGRKDSGISVEIAIEDQDIPGFTDGSPEDLSEEQTVAAPVAPAAPKAALAAVASPMFTTSVKVEAPVETADPVVSAKLPSLFGSSD